MKGNTVNFGRYSLNLSYFCLRRVGSEAGASHGWMRCSIRGNWGTIRYGQIVIQQRNSMGFIFWLKFWLLAAAEFLLSCHLQYVPWWRIWRFFTLIRANDMVSLLSFYIFSKVKLFHHSLLFSKKGSAYIAFPNNHNSIPVLFVKDVGHL